MSTRYALHERHRPIAAVALDVGGTTTHGALVTLRGLIPETLTTIPSHADGPREVIVNGLLALAQRIVEAGAQTHDVPRMGVGFPGPFDYRRGVSLMRHKYASLHDFPLGEALASGTGLDVVFLNDADAFAFGAWHTEFAGVERLLGITLGTGVGSGFVVAGAIAGQEEGAPPDGDIWNLPFREHTLEHYVSAEAISGAYRVQSGREDTAVKEIAHLARTGDGSALSVFRRFASDLGEGVAAVAGRFGPDQIAIGGQIGRAFDLFGRSAEAAYAEVIGRPVPWSPVRLDHPQLVGAGYVALSETSARSRPQSTQ